MIAVIFEVEPDPAHRQEYLDTAAALRAELEAIDGFLSVERFESLARPAGRVPRLPAARGRGRARLRTA
jgi:quinol monooxygenase YgiN